MIARYDLVPINVMVSNFLSGKTSQNHYHQLSNDMTLKYNGESIILTVSTPLVRRLLASSGREYRDYLYGSAFDEIDQSVECMEDDGESMFFYYVVNHEADNSRLGEIIYNRFYQHIHNIFELRAEKRKQVFSKAVETERTSTHFIQPPRFPTI